MRIGIFSNAYKPEISGVVQSISTFRDELVRRGHAVYIFAPEAAHYEDDDYGIFRYPAIRLPASVNFPLGIPVSPFIDWVVPRLKLDILHSQHPILIGEEAITFAKTLNLPHVFTHHTQYLEYSHYIPFNQNIVKTLTREVVRAYLARSVKIIAPTESIKAQLADQYPGQKERLAVLPSPIDPERFRGPTINPHPIRQKHHLEDKFTFVSVARLTPEKSFDKLLNAFAIGTANHPKARLMIVGDGTSKKDLIKLAEKLEIASKVIFTGAVEFHEVPNHLAACNAFAFASSSETQGLVMAEGMAAGLPVVAVDAPGNRDVVIDDVNGLLVTNTVDDLAEGMKRLIESTSLCRRLAEGAAETAEAYSAATLTHQLVDLYQDAIDKFNREPINYSRFAPQDEPRHFPPQWLVEITGGSTDWIDSLASFWHKLGS